MQIDWWTIALQSVNFAVLAWLLHRFLYRPVMGLADRRRQEVKTAFDEAAEAQADAESARRDFERRSETLETERLGILDAAHAEALADREQVAEDAKRRAEAIAKDAATRLEQEREDSLHDLRERSIDLATAIATRLLSAVASVSLCESFLDHAERHLADLSEHELSDLTGADPTVTVVTAPALESHARDQWTKRLRRHLGDDVQLDFQADPALIAGVELRLPRARLRFSLSDTLDRVRKELAPHAGPEDRRRPLAS